MCVEESEKEAVLQVPAPFGYERATSVEHALMLLAELGPEARLLAGGHSLLPMMKLRLAAPSHVIDIDPLADEHLQAPRRPVQRVPLGHATYLGVRTGTRT